MKDLVQSMNNHGVRLASEESYLEAIQTFSRALTLVRRLLALDNNKGATVDDSIHASPQQSDFQEESQGASAMISNLSAPELVALQRYEEEPANNHVQLHLAGGASRKLTTGTEVSMSTDEEDDFIFCHLIHSHHLATTSSTNFVDMYSFTLIFNMAVCHHLNIISGRSQKRKKRHQERGKKLVQGCETTWETTLKLYELAYEMQMSDGVEVPLVYLCALFNNMAHVHLEMHNDTASQQCLAALLSGLMYYVAVGRLYDERTDSPNELLNAYLPHFFGAVTSIVCSESTTIVAEAA